MRGPEKRRTEKLIVTLDGPAGSGKSSVARLLAKRLGVDFLDTGAMYRGLTAWCLSRGVKPATQAEAVAELARGTVMEFDWTRDPPRLQVGGRDLTDRLRDADVTAGVSDVAGIGAVREVMVEAQRRIGRLHPRLVTEGRDQGSVVFPDAQVKFFLEAGAQVRATRRAAELRAAGRAADVEEILRDIVRRDERDSSRKDGPLVCPAGAVRVDTSDLSLEQVLDRLEGEVRARVPGRAGDV